MLRKVAQGLTSRQIAEGLGISKYTVDHYRASGVEKTGRKLPAEISAFLDAVDDWTARHPRA